MILNSHRGPKSAWRHLLAVVALSGTVALYGCGGSEEMVEEETPFEDGEPLGANEEQAEAKPYDQALTSFVGAPEPAPEKPAEQPPAQVQPALSAYEVQLEEIRTENTSLKQKMVKLEQDNRTLNARLTDTESKLIAEADRANKAEEAAKTGAPPMAAPAETPEVTEATPAIAVTNYEEALKAFNARQYDNAIAGLQGLLDAGVPDDIADNCKYWLGESNYGKRDYQAAAKWFEEVMLYKTSEKKADAQFMLAQCYDRLGNKQLAKDSYEKVVKEYPMSNHVKRAKERWARL